MLVKEVNMNSIKWRKYDSGEQSYTYTRDQTRVLMAEFPLTRWEPIDGDGYYVMSKGGVIYYHEGDKHVDGIAILPSDRFKCLGCTNGCSDSDDTGRCDHCNRPLDRYPHYWECVDVAGGELLCGEVFCWVAGDDILAFTEEGKWEVLSVGGEQWFEEHPLYERISRDKAKSMEKDVCTNEDPYPHYYKGDSDFHLTLVKENIDGTLVLRDENGNSWETSIPRRKKHLEYCFGYTRIPSDEYASILTNILRGVSPPASVSNLGEEEVEEQVEGEGEVEPSVAFVSCFCGNRAKSSPVIYINYKDDAVVTVNVFCERGIFYDVGDNIPTEIAQLLLENGCKLVSIGSIEDGDLTFSSYSCVCHSAYELASTLEHDHFELLSTPDSPPESSEWPRLFVWRENAYLLYARCEKTLDGHIEVSTEGEETLYSNTLGCDQYHSVEDFVERSDTLEVTGRVSENELLDTPNQKPNQKEDGRTREGDQSPDEGEAPSDTSTLNVECPDGDILVFSNDGINIWIDYELNLVTEIAHTSSGSTATRYAVEDEISSDLAVRLLESGCTIKAYYNSDDSLYYRMTSGGKLRFRPSAPLYANEEEFPSRYNSIEDIVEGLLGGVDHFELAILPDNTSE